jgi:hypothetical protein
MHRLARWRARSGDALAELCLVAGGAVPGHDSETLSHGALEPRDGDPSMGASRLTDGPPQPVPYADWSRRIE